MDFILYSESVLLTGTKFFTLTQVCHSSYFSCTVRLFFIWTIFSLRFYSILFYSILFMCIRRCLYKFYYSFRLFSSRDLVTAFHLNKEQSPREEYILLQKPLVFNWFFTLHLDTILYLDSLSILTFFLSCQLLLTLLSTTCNWHWTRYNITCT